MKLLCVSRLGAAAYLVGIVAACGGGVALAHEGGASGHHTTTTGTGVTSTVVEGSSSTTGASNTVSTPAAASIKLTAATARTTVSSKLYQADLRVVGTIKCVAVGKMYSCTAAARSGTKRCKVTVKVRLYAGKLQTTKLRC